MNPSGERRACQDPDVAWAFNDAIDNNGKGRDEYLAVCYATCRFCPVRRSCYEDGLRMNAHGVWGGIHLDPPRYAVKNTGVCARGHDITGANGSPRHDGSRKCRRCERERAIQRKTKAPA